MAEESYETLRIEFPNADGELLAARLEMPRAEPSAFALFAHCFTCSKDVHAASRISRALTADGFAVLRFDFTGLGGSEGDFANTSFSSNIEDLLAAAAWLAREHRAPGLLIGHSLGGAAVLAASQSLPDVRAVATIAAPSNPSHVRGLFESIEPEVEARGLATVSVGGRPFTITRSFLDDLDAHPLEEQLSRSTGKAYLLFHAPGDRVVPIEHARRIFDAAPFPKSFVSLDGADHLLGREQDSQFVADLLAVWARRHLEG